MFLAWPRRAGAAAFAVAVLACGCNGGKATSGLPAVSLDAGESAIDALRFDVQPGLECADAGAAGICVAPSQVVTFGVEGLPGTVVSLALQGDYADAALTTEQITLSGSPVTVTLESSSTTATFSVVARVGSAASQQTVALPVTVSTSGSATIEASPSYLGHRPTPEYYATDFVLSTCAELTASAPDASTVPWTSGPNGVAIALLVPAGERVAVQMRIGHYAFGCADVDPLVPQATIALPVQIYDVPMALSLTDLTATFSFASDAATTSGWTALGQTAAARIEGAFFASAEPDGSALLDAMQTAIGASAAQAQFAQLRSSGGWDATAAAWMASHTPAIKTRAATWLTAATTDPMGSLVMNIGNGTSSGTAPVTAVTFGPLTWVAAGIIQPSPFQWTADANDTVHLSGVLDLAFTPLLAHEADLHAASSVTGATDVASAIALGIDCTGLASSLVGTGVSYGTCGAVCTASLCSSALTATWAGVAVPAASGVDLVTTTITASAPAVVGDLAEPASVQGGWLGSVSGAGVPAPDGGAGSFAVTGSVLATEP